jgi:hypothetical protein
MKRTVLLIVGVLLVLTGVVWTLQGLGYLAGSVMTGVTVWAVIGPVVAIVGAGLVAAGIRSGRSAP